MKEKLLKLANEIVPYNMQHNAEAEACDLLMEIEKLNLLEEYVDESGYPRVCLYLTRYGMFNALRRIAPFPYLSIFLYSCVAYVPDPENTNLLKTSLNIFRKFNRYPEALRLAMMLNNVQLVEEIFMDCKDAYVLVCFLTTI